MDHKRVVERLCQTQGFGKSVQRKGGVAKHDVMQAQVEMQEAVQKIILLGKQDKRVGYFIRRRDFARKDSRQDTQGLRFAPEPEVVCRFIGRNQRLGFFSASLRFGRVERDDTAPAFRQPQARTASPSFEWQSGQAIPAMRTVRRVAPCQGNVFRAVAARSRSAA